MEAFSIVVPEDPSDVFTRGVLPEVARHVCDAKPVPAVMGMKFWNCQSH
jgi:hypothetical protein